MALESVLPFIAGLLALVIAIALFRLYYIKRRIYHLLWGVGMLLWSVSDFTQLYALLFGWTVPVYLAYFFGSIMLAGFLGAGTLCLVSSRQRINTIYIWFNVVMAIALLVSLLVYPLNTAALSNAVTGANPVTGPANIIAALVNIPALITFVGGALYSYVKTWKIYALLIAFGGLWPAIGGVFATFGIPILLPFTDFLGIAFLGAGFYLSFMTPRDGRKNTNKKKR